MSKFDFVPKTPEELYNHFFKVTGGVSIVGTLIKGIAKHATAEEFETLSQDVFVRMLDHNLIAKFDSAKGNFGGVVFFTVRSVVVNYLERKARDPMGGLKAGSLVDQIEDGEFEAGTYSMETLDEGSDKEGRAVEAGDSIAKLARYLEGLARKATNTRDRNLVKVLELLAEEQAPSEIAEALGVTKSTISNWMARIAEITTELKLV